VIPVVAIRYAEPVTGGTLVQTESRIVWPQCSVDYGNFGATQEPPTRTGTNLVTVTDRGYQMSLPLSVEGVFVPDNPPWEEEDDDTSINGEKVSVRWIAKFRRF
jgi:hypothetical protein